MKAVSTSVDSSNALLSKQRYEALDALKCICAFLVITIHVAFRGNVGTYCKAIARMAVPIFFMISGFFMEEHFSRSSPRFFKTFIKLLKLILISNLLYFFWGIFYYHFYENAKTITDLVLFITGGNNWQRKILSYICFHSTLVYEGYHLWYLNALFYAWTIVYCIKYFFRAKGTRFLHYLAPLLLVHSVIFSNYSSILLGRFNELASRNFLFCGIPYITLGNWIYQKQKPLCKFFSLPGILSLLIILSAAVCLEEYILSSIRLSKDGDYYICTAFQAIAAFLLFLKIHYTHPKALWLKPLAKIGSRHSLYIYILHLIVQLIIWKALLRFRYYYLYDLFNIEPILVFFVTLIASELSLQILRFLSRITHLKIV